ncbi:hypothetical protein [Streptomyces sp. NPDC085937]|uniref:hypothetical protein n=1 Tax=Streptomyces sp. NPDC085937 TaxID=3365742 RepID=UPI0037D47038
MSDHSTVATDLTSQYVAQVTNDLERNVKEQERVGAEIADLQQQLTVLQRDHTLLVKMRQALEVATAPAAAAAAVEAAEPVTPAEPAASATGPAATTEAAEAAEPATSAEEPAVTGGATVPAPRTRSSVTSGAEKPKRTRKKAAASAGAATSAPSGSAKSAKSARKPSTAKPAGKPSATKAARTASAPAKAARTRSTAARPTAAKPAAARPAKGDTPKLVDLVRRHLGEQNEPRSAAEVAAALGEAHPGRGIKTTVVRSTLEGLVARNQAQRTKQGSSVFYTTPDGTGPAPERAADARA